MIPTSPYARSHPLVKVIVKRWRWLLPLAIAALAFGLGAAWRPETPDPKPAPRQAVAGLIPPPTDAPPILDLPLNTTNTEDPRGQCEWLGVCEGGRSNA